MSTAVFVPRRKGRKKDWGTKQGNLLYFQVQKNFINSIAIKMHSLIHLKLKFSASDTFLCVSKWTSSNYFLFQISTIRTCDGVSIANPGWTATKFILCAINYQKKQNMVMPLVSCFSYHDRVCINWNHSMAHYDFLVFQKNSNKELSISY